MVKASLIAVVGSLTATMLVIGFGFVVPVSSLRLDPFRRLSESLLGRRAPRARSVKSFPWRSRRPAPPRRLCAGRSS